MTFHRLANPSYYIPGGGPLLPSYDLLNDPTTTGGTGIPIVPDPGPKVGGVYDGVYFITSGSDEPANAYNLNRPARAVAESIDILDDRDYRSIAAFTFVSVASVGDATHDLDGSVNNIYTGGAGIADDYFHVTDDLSRPIFVDGERVRVATSSIGIGSGFSAANPLTLTFNKTIPSGVTYFVYFTIRSAFTDLPVDSFSWKSAQPVLNIQGYRYDDDVVTVSGGGVSGTHNQTKGDVHTVDLEPYITGTTVRGDMVLRAGNYTIGGANHWTEGTHVRASRLADGSKISITAGRASNVNLIPATAGLAFHDISLATASTANYHFVAQTDFIYEANAIAATVEAGALELGGLVSYVSHRLSNMRLTANSTLTTSTAGFKVTGLAALDMDNCTLEAVPTASTPTAHMLIDTYAGRAHIRNCRIGGSASGVDGLRINAVANTVGRVLFENCNIYHNGTGDAWAVNIINSFGVHFKNCRFFSERGQAIRVENSGVTFENCTVESGTDTTLASPQLICGYGHAVSNQPFRILNCTAIFNSANVRGGAVAPTKAIIELGGILNATDGDGNPTAGGPVEVDGLLITPVSSALSVHNMTSVLLRDDETNVAPNQYRNVTIDMKGCVPLTTGTLRQHGYQDGTFGIFAGKGHIVEILGAVVAVPDGLKHTIVKNLQILRVGMPASSMARGVFCAARVDVDGLTIDGDAAGAGDYTSSIVQFAGLSDVRDVKMFPTVALKSTNTSAMALYALLAGVRVVGLRYHHRGIENNFSGPLFALSADCTVKSAVVLVDLAVSLNGKGLLKFLDHRGRLEDSVFIVDGIVGTGGGDSQLILNTNNKRDLMVSGNLFRWDNDGNTDDAEMVLLQGADRSVVQGNQFLTTDVTAGASPTLNVAVSAGDFETSPVSATLSAAAPATPDGSNVVSYSADTGIPYIY